jgi:hypothetical protein
VNHCWQIAPALDVITFYCTAPHDCRRILNLTRDEGIPIDFEGVVAALENLIAPFQHPRGISNV